MGHPVLPPPSPPPACKHPHAPTCVAGILAVAKALEGTLGPALGAHACGRPNISVTPGGRQDPEPPEWEPREGCTQPVAYLLQAGAWGTGKEAEGTRCPQTGCSPSPRQEVEGTQCGCTSNPVASPLRPHRGSGPTAVGVPGDLGPGLTWAAARTF